MSIATKLAAEARMIRKKICSDDYLIILDSQGFSLNNAYLVSEFKKLMIDGRIEMTKFNFVQQCIHEIML